MYLRGTFHQTGDVNVKDISRRVCNIAIGHISGAIVPHKISDLSMTLLSKIDVEATKKQRFTNYKYLYDNLHGDNDCFPVERNFEELTCSPLFFPIYVKDRPALQKKLAQQEIYAPVLWPVHTDTVLINEGIKRIYDEILMLPIDQRYGVEDMKRMIEVIKS
jgi:dTDP-4-amino-4,6-dideoxygalactose transaminase